MTTRLRTLDRPYAWGHFLGAGQPGAVAYTEGQGILFTAPHAVCQIRGQQVKMTKRNGQTRFVTQTRYKASDRYTGAMAELLAETTGAGALALVGAKGDAAQDDPHPFRDQLAVALETGHYGLVIDLHGMANSHGVDLAIGLGAFPTPGLVRTAADLAQAADDHGLFWSINHDGMRAAELTITSYAQRYVPALQVELAADVRRPRNERTRQALQALTALVEQVAIS